MPVVRARRAMREERRGRAGRRRGEEVVMVGFGVGGGFWAFEWWVERLGGG